MFLGYVASWFRLEFVVGFSIAGREEGLIKMLESLTHRSLP